MYLMQKKSSAQRSLGRRIAGVTMPVGRKRMRWGRNWPCLCGSQEKYKRCCLSEIDNLTAHDGNAVEEKLSEDVQRLIDAHNAEEERKGGKKKDE